MGAHSKPCCTNRLF